MRMGESERSLEIKMRAKDLDVPLGSQIWTPLPEPVIFKLKSSNPRRCFGCADHGGACVFLSERRQGRCYRKSASEGERGDIYSLGSKSRMGI